MRLIHTSDWHLGKELEKYSRLDEQIRFCDDFVRIVEDNKADMVIIAGDIYDTANPSAAAESLFYETIERLADGGRRCIIVISGNHDSPDRLASCVPLAKKMGISIFGYPLSSTEIGKFKGFEILEAKEGFTKIRIKDETVNLITLPYPSEKRLNEAFGSIETSEHLQRSYSSKVGDIFRKLEENYRDDEINIAASHIFVTGSSVTDSERRIELGGSLLVEKKDLPSRSQYTALGHIHKPQRISREYRAYYSGSPIQYSKMERSSSKSVYMVDLKAGEEAIVEALLIKNYRPIYVYKADSVDKAMEICRENSGIEQFAYFEIKTDDVIDMEKSKEMKSLVKNIVEITPVLEKDEYREEVVTDIASINITDYFIDFFTSANDGLKPPERVIDLFNQLISQERENETD